jgi:DNA-binding transcriptional regulator YiaG
MISQQKMQKVEIKMNMNPNPLTTKAVAASPKLLQGYGMTVMNGAQCRAARGLLNMRQSALAEAADVSISTVVDFEQSRRQVSDELVRAMQVALEAAGVAFLPDSGLKLKRGGRKGKRRE